MRKTIIYEQDDIELFKQKAFDYLSLRHRRKSINDLCEHLQISRQTLYRYRQREGDWYKVITGIKIFIYGYNALILTDGCLPGQSDYNALLSADEMLEDIELWTV